MKTIKNVLNFCNAAVFYDYKNIDTVLELKQVRKCITNIFTRNNTSQQNDSIIIH